MKKKQLNPIDEYTMTRFTIVPPVKRRDAKPFHPCPIRRFREELRLSREDFARLMKVKVDTARSWERPTNPTIPAPARLEKMIDLARRNKYPLLIEEIWKYAEDRRH